MNKKKILVVDDDLDQRSIYEAMFKESGFDVRVAEDGLQASDIAFEDTPDLVFTGVIMPKMDGFELVEHLRKHVATAKIPIIMFSHLGREEDRKKASAYGLVTFMVKGYDSPQSILARAKQLLGVSEKSTDMKFNE